MSPDIPKTQRAAVLFEPGAEIQIVADHPVKQPSELLPGQCLVKLAFSGVCHTDLHIKLGDWPIKTKSELIGGHEGAGTVVAVGEHTQNTRIKVGDRVGVKFIADSCMNCEMCRKGAEAHCFVSKKCGFDIDGTFSEYAVVYVNHLTPIPASLELAAAASIMCAGLTVYRAIKYSNTHIGDWIVIPGAGGGLGHLAVQYAVAMGLRVVAIDTGEEKRIASLGFGAEKWIDFMETKDIVLDVCAATDGYGPHAAIITASTSAAYTQAVAYLRPTGYLMAIGLPPQGLLQAPILLTVAKGITIRGSYVGNRQDGEEAVAIAASGKVKCKYTLRGLSELTDVYDAMSKGQLVGRVVLDLEK